MKISGEHSKPNNIMKKFNLFAAAVAVSVLGGAAVSCNKTETPAPVEKNLPELKDVTVTPGSTETITFYAYGAWTVEVDKTWCTPDKTSGEKGDNTINFEVADAFEAAETAKVTLTIGEDKDVVTFNITRSAKEREFAVTSSTDGSSVAELVFGEDAKSVEIKVKANFWWQLDAADDCNAQWPLWLSKPSPRFEGKAGDIVTVTLTVDEEQLPNFYDSKEGVIWFNDVENPAVKYSINVKHTFEKPEFLSSDRGTSLRIAYTSFCFYAADGQTVTTDKSVAFKVTPEAGDINYQVFMYYFENCTALPAINKFRDMVPNDSVWLQFKKGSSDKEYNLSVIGTPVETAMGPFIGYTTKVYIFLVPNSVYGTFQSDISGHSSMRNILFDSCNNGVAESEIIVKEEMKKYLIEVAVDLPA